MGIRRTHSRRKPPGPYEGFKHVNTHQITTIKQSSVLMLTVCLVSTSACIHSFALVNTISDRCMHADNKTTMSSLILTDQIHFVFVHPCTSEPFAMGNGSTIESYSKYRMKMRIRQMISSYSLYVCKSDIC